MNNYRRFVLNLFDHYLDIKISESYGHILATSAFRKFYSYGMPLDIPGGHFACTILNFRGDSFPHMQGSGLSPDIADFPIFQYDVTKNQVPDGASEYAFIHPTRLAIFCPDKLAMRYYACIKNFNIIEKIIASSLFLFTASFLAEHRGLLLHAYGLVIDGLFCAITGPSGAGKSTAGGLIEKDVILSNDIIGITNIDGQPYAHASPLALTGITDGPNKAPLSAFFFPVKSDKFDIQPMQPKDAFIKYLHEHVDYVGRLFKPYKAVYFELAHILFHKVPSYELHFPMDHIDTDKIKDIMARSDIIKNQ